MDQDAPAGARRNAIAITITITFCKRRARQAGAMKKENRVSLVLPRTQEPTRGTREKKRQK